MHSLIKHVVVLILLILTNQDGAFVCARAVKNDISRKEIFGIRGGYSTCVDVPVTQCAVFNGRKICYSKTTRVCI